MKINSVKYLKSFKKIEDFNLSILPSYAFIGRSNVGKSSIINTIVQRKNYIKTSSTPGKTQLINYFLINEGLSSQFYLIDLPGYGFAKIPLSIREQWQFMIYGFLLNCPNLIKIFQIVDIRHSPSQEDIQFQSFLQNSKITSCVIANKSDKLKKNQIKISLKHIQAVLNLKSLPIEYSVPINIGRKEVIQSLHNTNN